MPDKNQPGLRPAVASAAFGMMAVLATGPASALPIVMTGGDSGQGLTLNPATVEYAVNSGDAVVNNVLQGVIFAPLTGNPDITLTYIGTKSFYVGSGAFLPAENSADDDAAENLANDATFAFVGANNPTGIFGTLNNLSPGRYYRVNQLLTESGALTRNLNITYNEGLGTQAIESFNTSPSGSIRNVETIVLAQGNSIPMRTTSSDNSPIVGSIVVSEAGFLSTTTIIQAGTHQNVGEGLRSTSVPKTRDLDGDGAYGTDGNEFWGLTPVLNQGGGSGAFEDGDPDGAGPLIDRTSDEQLPAYVANIAPVVGGFTTHARDFGYAQTDDPTAPIGAVVANVDSGVAFRGGTVNNTEYPLFDIVFGANVPGLVRIGLFTDNEGGLDQTARSFRIASLDNTINSGPMATVTQGFGTLGVMDGYFFDLFLINPGATFRVYGVSRGPATSNIVLSGITFDSLPTLPIPEPASLSLLALAGLASFGRWARASRRRAL